MITRDKNDMKNMVVAKGAFVLDTTNLSIEEVLDVILSKIKRS